MVLDSYFISYSITGTSKILVFQYAAMSLDILRMLEALHKIELLLPYVGKFLNKKVSSRLRKDFLYI
jgi:hypothetical protein